MIFQQRQIWFETMSQQPTRQSKEDNLLSGTIAARKDNISKLDLIKQLDEFLAQLRSSFRVRLDNHEKASHLKNFDDRQSNFCMSYPTGQLGQQGKHEHLRPHCAFGYNPNEQNAVEEIISTQFLNWDAAQPHFESLKSKNKSAQSAKHISLSCLIECCCDLSLSKQHNVSDSPGFESIHGQHGGKKV